MCIYVLSTYRCCSSSQLVPELREEAKKLEEKVQAFDKLKDMEQKVEDLEMELHWAIVYEIESVSSHVLVFMRF